MESNREGAATPQSDTEADAFAERGGEVPVSQESREASSQWWRNDAPGPREVQ